MDARIAWIKSKVESGLFLQFQEAKLPPALKSAASLESPPVLPACADPFQDCLERDNSKASNLLNAFLNTPNQNSMAVIFWAELVTLKSVVQVPATNASIETTTNDLAIVGDEESQNKPVVVVSFQKKFTLFRRLLNPSLSYTR